jgi:hypothetical protein
MVYDRQATQNGAGRRTDHKTVAIALMLSALLHFLALNITFEEGRDDSPSRRDGRGARTPLDGIRVVELVRPQAPPEVPAVELEPDEPILFDLPAEEIESELDEPPTDPTLDTSGRPSLGPRLSDPRLWRPTTSRGETRPLLNGQPQALLDSLNRESVGVRTPAAGDMSVWTPRDADGNRWGFSPGQIHLGSISLPLCGGNFDASNCGFGIPPSFREEYRNQIRALLEIQQQDNRALLEERARAIRARLEAVRDSVPSP